MSLARLGLLWDGGGGASSQGVPPPPEPLLVPGGSPHGSRGADVRGSPWSIHAEGSFGFRAQGLRSNGDGPFLMQPSYSDTPTDPISPNTNALRVQGPIVAHFVARATPHL